MFIILGQHNLFVESPFFTFGGKFTLLGLVYNDESFYLGLNFAFFFNSLFATLNNNIVAPVFSRMIMSHSDENECHGSDYKFSKTYLYIILVVFDTWTVVRSLFNLLGILSNIGFFLATSAGFLIADISVKYIYINHPEQLNFHPKNYAQVSGDDDEEVSLRKQVQMKFGELGLKY